MLATRTRAETATPYRAWGAGWVSACAIAMSRNFALPLSLAAHMSRSWFIMLSMLTGNCQPRRPVGQDWIQPTWGLKRVLSDSAAVSRTSR